MGGLAVADFMAGALAAVLGLAGLLTHDEEASGIEVSLLGAALSLQAQRFVSRSPKRPSAAGPLSSEGLRLLASSIEQASAWIPTKEPTHAANGPSSPCLSEQRPSDVQSARCSASRTPTPKTRRPRPPAPSSWLRACAT